MNNLSIKSGIGIGSNNNSSSVGVGGLMGGMINPNHSNPGGGNPTTMTSNNINSINSINNAITTNNIPIPIPIRNNNNNNKSLSRFHRQKLRKSHSRTDLVREMALDRRVPTTRHQHHPNNQQQQSSGKKRGSFSTTASSATVGARNSSNNSNHNNGELLDASSISSLVMMEQQQQQQLLNVSNHSNKSAGAGAGAGGGGLLKGLVQPHHQKGGAVTEEGQLMSTSQHGSQGNLLQGLQQQQQGTVAAEENESTMAKSTSSSSLSKSSTVGDIHRRNTNNTMKNGLYAGLEDPLDARGDLGAQQQQVQPSTAAALASGAGERMGSGGGGGGRPGSQWMQGWIPPNPIPLTSRRRESSSGSSGTAITNNRSLDILNENQIYTSGSNVRTGAAGRLSASAMSGALGSGGGLGGLSAALQQPKLPSQLNNPTQQQQQQGGGGAGCSTTNCDRCLQLETTLLSLQADLEYLRTLELQREYNCQTCDDGGGGGGSVHGNSSTAKGGNGGGPRLERMDSSLPPINQNTAYPSDRSVSSAVSIGSRESRTSSRIPGRRTSTSSIGQRHRSSSTIGGRGGRSLASRTSMYLRDASKRLADLSTRHKRQVKQTTHERAYWQNDMHLKLEKFALMCKNLNEEAAHRSNEVKETKALLDKMTSERNTLTSQMDTLRARVELYEEENILQSQLREEWEKEKSIIFDSIDTTAKDRDVSLDDLSHRLSLAVKTIENERKQQRMRRQIIFPQTSKLMDNSSHSAKLGAGDNNNTYSASGGNNPSPHSKSNSSLGDPPISEYDLDRIQKSKELAQKAQLSLQTAMVQSAAREKAMQERLDGMECELAEARAAAKMRMVPSGPVEMEVPLSPMEGSDNGVKMSLRRSSSAASMGSIGSLAG